MRVNHLALLTCSAIEMGFAALPTQAKVDYAKLKTLHSKVLCIKLSQLNWPLYFVFAKQIHVFSYYEGQADVSVIADASTLYTLTEGANLTELIKQDKLQLKGDIQLLQTFSHYLQQIEFDFAEPLSKYIGDAPAHILTQQSKRLINTSKDVAMKSVDHMGQLLNEEYKLTLHKIDYLHFKDNIEDIVNDTDQLAQQITKLRDKIIT
ncbi:SCP2 domain-containing protein [Shewanella intestini]|uniref:Ubiquinone biosynthesis accessory factor UbiJ n=1 Tax=Shewanella intestini TaxID=2017544 RepID=A0ABS5I2F3_9GAMM|nr:MULTISPECIES: SCP2 sterol-binding domain-containing protein [Shewanella]MBR9727535.1 sterol-binding protein [Shewanella intestini]MRG35315.1 sterol-binding protein [Shewanella sp. XMDDZSB0408]